MKTKSETKKTSKPAASQKDAVVLEYALAMWDIGGNPVQEFSMDYGEYQMLTLHRCMWEETTDGPAIDDSAPDWVMETPDNDYVLAVWFEGGDELTRISLTRAQYIELKAALAYERAMRSAKRAA